MWMEIHTNLANQLRNPPKWEHHAALGTFLDIIPYIPAGTKRGSHWPGLICAWNERKWQADRRHRSKRQYHCHLFPKGMWDRNDALIDCVFFFTQKWSKWWRTCVFLSLFSLSSPDLAFGVRNPMELCDSFQTVISHQHGVIRNLVNNGSKKYWHCAVRISSD